MIRPLEILHAQIGEYLNRALATEEQTIQLSQNDFDALKTNFNQLCYEVQQGKLDEVLQEFVNNPKRTADRTYHAHDLNNLVLILETTKAAE